MTGAKISINSIYTALRREVENDPIQEIPRNYYQSASTVLGTITREKYDGVEGVLNTRFFTIASELATLFLRTRLEKVLNNPHIDKINLLDEEKFILDSNTDMDTRKNMIITGVLRGKSKLLESIATSQKTKPVLIRFLQDAEQIVGADMAKYGPFKAEDVSSVPYDNAQAFIRSKKFGEKKIIRDGGPKKGFLRRIFGRN